MKSFVDNQGKDEPFMFGSELECHMLEFFSFAFMIGDSLSQHRMCGRYLAYANIPRLCHGCMQCYS